jgi:hypothetical protein
MAARESFYTKSEPRFYKEVYKQNVNIRDFSSQINPLSHAKNDSSDYVPKFKKDMRTTNNIFGEEKQVKVDWFN